MQIPLNHWYAVLDSSEVRTKPVGVERFGTRLVFWRDHSGDVHALPDRCPHLGAALSLGRICGGELACPFHGIRFDGTGRCTHVPALGASVEAPQVLAMRAYPLLERHGLIWLWWGSADPDPPEPAFFPELDRKWSHGTVTTEWPVHYTRAIENQLDVAHLAFVHRTTIGRGGRSLVEGPHVEADDDGVRVWVFNRRDDGQPPREAAQLAQASRDRMPSLHFRFPGCWLLNISPRFRNFIAFVPVNEHCTRYYLRSYLRYRNPLLAPVIHWLVSLSNRLILGQDRRVVVTQPVGSSLEAEGEHLMRSDQAIMAFRRMLARHLQENRR